SSYSQEKLMQYKEGICMKKQCIITILLLISGMCQITLSMKKEDRSCWGWLTTTKKDRDYQSIPKEPTMPLTPIEKYYNLAIEATKQLNKKQLFGEIADLI